MIKAVVFDVGGTLFRSDSVEKDRELIAGEKIDNFFKMNKINFNLTPRQVADHMVAGDKNFKK
jgi:FMN phosphatase YigB (HAD superfamily)